MRIVVVGLAVAAVAVAAVANAAVRDNGPIFLFGSRVSNFDTEIYSVRADGTGRTNLTRNPASDTEPAVSPDGTRIAFVSGRDGYDAVYVMNPDGSGQERLFGRLFSTAYRIAALLWSPTGGRLAFTATQPPVGSLFESSTLHVVELSSGRVRVLGGLGCGGAAAFSPNGQLIAYGVAYCRSRDKEVKVVRADGGRERTVGKGWLVGWAPREQRLLYLRSTRNRNIDHVATIDSFGRHRWALPGFQASSATWSPAGRLIAFARTAGRRPGIYVVRPGGRRPLRIVTLAKSSSIAWSPNGGWLALATARAAGEQGVAIYLMRPSGRGLRRIAAARTLPIWSRDSRYVAFVGLDGAARVASPRETSVQRVTDPTVDALGDRLEWGQGDRLLFTAVAPGPRTT